MPVRDAAEMIRREVMSWDGVSEFKHRFGGIEFRFGKRELGHVHGDSLLDVPFPMNVRNELIAQGKVRKHHILPESGWVSLPIREEEDVAFACSLLRRSYEIAAGTARAMAERSVQQVR